MNLVLTETEIRSALWIKISAYLEQDLKSLRASNDNDQGENDTAKLRGQIAKVKELLRAGNMEQLLKDQEIRALLGSAPTDPT